MATLTQSWLTCHTHLEVILGIILNSWSSGQLSDIPAPVFFKRWYLNRTWQSPWLMRGEVRMEVVALSGSRQLESACEDLLCIYTAPEGASRALCWSETMTTENSFLVSCQLHLSTPSRRTVSNMGTHLYVESATTANKMAQWLKASAAKPAALSLIVRIQMVRGVLKVFLWPP